MREERRVRCSLVSLLSLPVAQACGFGWVNVNSDAHVIRVGILFFDSIKLTFGSKDNRFGKFIDN